MKLVLMAEDAGARTVKVKDPCGDVALAIEHLGSALLSKIREDNPTVTSIALCIVGDNGHINTTYGVH